MMSILYLLLTINLIIWPTRIIVDGRARLHPGDEVTFRMVTEKNEALVVNMIKTDSYLANENLPVWHVRGDKPNVLIPDTTVMKIIGPFSVYHNRDQSSAAIYFHDLHEFYGVVDVRYILKGIPIEHINDTFQMKSPSIWGVRERIHHQGHIRPRSVENEDSLPMTRPSMVPDQLFNDRLSSVKSRRDSPEVVYVQALIIVNYDLLEAIRNEYYRKFGMIEYLLTLFNNVDMLFSKVEELKIKINIAGVIIGTELKSFPSLTKCYKRKRVSGSFEYYMEVDCLNHALLSYVKKHSRTISPDSYNVAIFLTKHELRLQMLFQNLAVEGVNLDETDGPYKTRRHRSTVVPTISVHHEANFGSFHTIAHEMAHALRVHSHDQKPYVDDKGNCLAYLMKEGSDTCENCLSWSPTSKEKLQTFFSSRDRCFFVNKPQSLYKPGPRRIWTEDEQCQCYGYESASRPATSIPDKLCQVLIKNECQRNLRCRDSKGKSHNAPVPLDGTPCRVNPNNVCWNRKCRPVEADRIER